MGYTLPNEPRLTDYSPKERSVFKLIPQKDGKRISTLQLVDRYYNDKKPRQHARVIIGGVIASLMWKINHNREPFILRKTPRAGPHPIQYWVEKR